MMDEKLSALLDDELEAEEASACLELLSENAAARLAWSRQHMIRAVLKEQVSGETGELADRVMAALRSDPHGEGVPHARKVIPFRMPQWRSRQWAGGLALAASVAAVAMFLPLLNSQNSTAENPSAQIAEATASPAPMTRQVALERARANAEARRELQQYLLDHEALASGHGLSSQRAYMRMASPGTAHVTYSPER